MTVRLLEILFHLQACALMHTLSGTQPVRLESLPMFVPVYTGCKCKISPYVILWPILLHG